MGKPSRCAPRQKPFISYDTGVTTTSTTTNGPDFSNYLIIPNSGEICPTTTLPPSTTTTTPPRVIDPNFPCSSYSFLPNDNNGAVITFSPCDNDNSISQIVVGSVQRLDFCAENDGDVKILSGNGSIVFNNGCDRFIEEEKTTTTTTTTTTTSTTTLLEPLWEKTYTFGEDEYLIDFDIDYTGNYIATLGTKSTIYIKNNTTYVPLVSNNNIYSGDKINLNYTLLPGSPNFMREFFQSDILYCVYPYSVEYKNQNSRYNIVAYHFNNSLNTIQLDVNERNKGVRHFIDARPYDSELKIFEALSRLYIDYLQSYNYYTYYLRTYFILSNNNTQTLEYNGSIEYSNLDSSVPIPINRNSHIQNLAKSNIKTLKYQYFSSIGYDYPNLAFYYKVSPYYSSPKPYIQGEKRFQPFLDIEDSFGYQARKVYASALSHFGNVIAIEYDNNFVIFNSDDFIANYSPKNKTIINKNIFKYKFDTFEFSYSAEYDISLNYDGTILAIASLGEVKIFKNQNNSWIPYGTINIATAFNDKPWTIKLNGIGNKILIKRMRQPSLAYLYEIV